MIKVNSVDIKGGSGMNPTEGIGKGILQELVSTS